MAHPSIGVQGLNALLAGAVRLPLLFVSAKAAVLVGELAYRGIRESLGAFGFTGENKIVKTVTSWLPKTLQTKIKPEETSAPAEMSAKDIAISAIAYSAIGVLGTTLVSGFFGPAPKIYNEVLSWIGPVRISNDKHPLVQIIATAIRR